MTALTLRHAQLPASIRTLRRIEPGERVLINCVLRNRAFPACRQCVPAGVVVMVRDNGPDGVIVTLPDGTDRRIDPGCADRVQVEPVNGAIPR